MNIGPLKICKVSHSSGLPHVCKAIDFVENEKSGGINYVVMQLQGKNLANLKKRKGKKFTMPFALTLLLQILESIEDMLSRGYIHRDIKPVKYLLSQILQ